MRPLDRSKLAPAKSHRVGGLASSAQHHQGDGPASSAGHLRMGGEQCAGGILVGGLLGVLELRAVVEVVQSLAADECRWGCQCR